MEVPKNQPNWARVPSASGKRPVQDLGTNPGWVNTFTQAQYEELGQQMTQLKSDYDVQELEWQRKLTDLRQSHEETMTDAVANKVMEALNEKVRKARCKHECGHRSNGDHC